jgi:hypothetical protein
MTIRKRFLLATAVLLLLAAVAALGVGYLILMGGRPAGMMPPRPNAEEAPLAPHYATPGQSEDPAPPAPKSPATVPPHNPTPPASHYTLPSFSWPWADNSRGPPRPDAQEAPPTHHSALGAPRSGQPSPAEEDSATEYHWPPDFQLPLVLHIDAPPVPKELSEPSAPIKKKS